MTQPQQSFPVETDPFYVEDLEQMSRAENYRRWQFAMLAPYVGGKVLEVGGGIGNFTSDLAGIAESVTSIEPNAYCHARLLAEAKGMRNVAVYQATVETLEQHLRPDQLFDAIVLMNVLEHIKEDEAVLRSLKRRLSPGGRFVILVPAGPWAFGHIDERLGHYRRYSKTMLRDLMGRSGLGVDQLRYFNFVGIWAWWWNAKVSRRQNQSDSQIRLFDRYLVPVISRIEKVLPPPTGQSLLVVGRQPRL